MLRHSSLYFNLTGRLAPNLASWVKSTVKFQTSDNDNLGRRCFCKVLHFWLHFIFKMWCHYAVHVGPETHDLPILVSKVWDYKDAPLSTPSCATSFLLSFLSRIKCYRHVSLDQDGTGHKAGASHSWTRNQCHAVQQILPPSAHYLLRVHNQGECAVTPWQAKTEQVKCYLLGKT